MADLRLIVNPDPIVVEEEEPEYKKNPDDHREHFLTRAEAFDRDGHELQDQLAEIAEGIRAIREGRRSAKPAQLAEHVHSTLTRVWMVQNSLLGILREPPVRRPKRRGRKPRVHRVTEA